MHLPLPPPRSAPSLQATLASLLFLRQELPSGPLPGMLFSQMSDWLPPSLPGGRDEKAASGTILLKMSPLTNILSSFFLLCFYFLALITF